MAKKTKPVTEETAAAQPYYLQRAHIKDFRSIRDAKVEFKPGLNIIIGKNGAGKTNLVRVLRNAVANQNSNLGSWNEFVFSGPHTLEVRLTRARIDAKKASFIHEMNKNRIEASLKIDGIDYFTEELLVNFWLDTNKKRVKEEKSQISPPNKILVINHGIPSEYQLIASDAELSIENYAMGTAGHYTRLGRTIIDGIQHSVFNAYLEHGVESTDLISVNIVEDIIGKIAEFNLERIRYALKQYSPISDVRLSDSIRIYHNKQQNEILVKGLVMEFCVNGVWLPFSALSSGTQRLFYIISEVLAPIQYYLAKKSRKGYGLNDSTQTILLEEPELGIHPDQLYLLLSFLREQSEKHQIIITTHSPQVLDMLNADELDRITICELDEKKGTQFRKLTKKKIATAQKFMKDVGYLSDFWLYSSLEEKSQSAS
ncbi:AAA family ATPase [Hymenobacter sp. ASUV-10]|uniref:AAA family ATPase n=1 Tax=Hymenobacter aranciens TaxID=3063996 RepID=A0ABT9BDV0_9BACT|nr:AAA family ATPase [Hymenobacter sp. ASUV-10]MDO7876392.1 AAA family ATPase [Hymenobacter sp. ASUV-10]